MNDWTISFPHSFLLSSFLHCFLPLLLLHVHPTLNPDFLSRLSSFLSFMLLLFFHLSANSCIHSEVRHGWLIHTHIYWFKDVWVNQHPFADISRCCSSLKKPLLIPATSVDVAFAEFHLCVWTTETSLQSSVTHCYEAAARVNSFD